MVDIKVIIRIEVRGANYIIEEVEAATDNPTMEDNSTMWDNFAMVMVDSNLTKEGLEVFYLG